VRRSCLAGRRAALLGLAVVVEVGHRDHDGRAGRQLGVVLELALQALEALIGRVL
jgi:hypothetical protein